MNNPYQNIINAQAGMTSNDYIRQNDIFGSRGLTKQEAIDQLTKQIESLNKQLEKLTLDDPLPSPTQRQLNANPALQNAWNEFNVIWKLTGK